jgi:hypothetical protein
VGSFDWCNYYCFSRVLGDRFLLHGGVGLVRLYRNYLSQDIADKKYTWRDFRNRGATEKLWAKEHWVQT